MIHRIVTIVTLASCAYASEFMDAASKWLSVEPIAPKVEWHANKAELLALNRPNYTSAMGWMYQEDTQTIYAFPCEGAAPSMRHEEFHALAHARLPKMPLWLNEGTACMMERCRVSDGKLIFTTHNRIRTAARSDVSLLDIVQYAPADFGGDKSQLVYASSYAAALWMNQTGKLQSWLHGERPEIMPDEFRAWLNDAWNWP
jgi:hypothetical protein